MRKLFLTLLIVFAGGVVYASISDYLELYQKRHQHYYQEMRRALAEAMEKESSAELKEIYRSIGYRPVWVDSENLSSNGELLLFEIREDLKAGLYRNLRDYYADIVKEEEELGEEPDTRRRLVLELDMMRLFVHYIHMVGHNRELRLEPGKLLEEAMKEEGGGLTSLFNKISRERVRDRTAYFEKKRSEALEEGSRLRGPLMRNLRRGNDRHRLYTLYERIGFQPVWISKQGLSSYTLELYREVESDPTLDENGSTLRVCRWLKQAPVPEEEDELAVRELEIAWLYQNYMEHLLYGRIDWRRFRKLLKAKHPHGAWIVHEVLLSPEMLLIEALNRGSLKYAFERARPDFPVYSATVEALKRYRLLAERGGWPELPASLKGLRPGKSHSEVPQLQKRLKIEGDYIPCSAEVNGTASTIYDDCLVEAVKRFQRRHGLEADGILGKNTLEALAESAEHKAARLRLNLDRLKWLKRDSDRYHIYVNIPDFHVTVLDRWNPLVKMRVVTGRKGHETPVFYNRVRRVVLNPYWRIPPSILRHETIPKLRKNPGYAARSRIEIHTGWSPDSPRVNPYSVDWHRYGKKLPPWHFMQSPGRKNALGKVKFLFPNPFSVYMHDTPEKNLFSRDIRAFSHGCVRLHRPVDMLRTIADIDAGSIDYNRALKILQGKKNTPLRLSRTIPIDIIYLSAWGEENATVQFRNDIYGYDALQLETLKSIKR